MRLSTFILPLCLLLSISCGNPRKLDVLRKKEMSATLALSRSEIQEERKVVSIGRKDTLTVKDDEGKRILIMKAVKDDESGEMVATDVIDAAVITARFRNVAERNGKVDIRFEVIVPASMQDSKWQLRLYPDMFVLEDSLRLQGIILTGADYRKAQLRGYELYDKYLRSIITDSTKFIDWRNLNIWIQRNLPDLYRFKEDSTFVAEEEFHSLFGPTERDAIRHYTLLTLKRKHEYKWRVRGQVFNKYVKAPLIKEGIRLDTVLRNADGDFVYQYVQTLQTRPRLRKVDVVLSGDIYEQDRKLYTMPRTAPLTFYISSLSSFADGTEKYITRVTERRAAANTACYVDFHTGKWDIDESLGHNREEMGRIRDNMRELLENEHFDIDSIVIAAKQLCRERGWRRGRGRGAAAGGTHPFPLPLQRRKLAAALRPGGRRHHPHPCRQTLLYETVRGPGPGPEGETAPGGTLLSAPSGGPVPAPEDGEVRFLPSPEGNGQGHGTHNGA